MFRDDNGSVEFGRSKNMLDPRPENSLSAHVQYSSLGGKKTISMLVGYWVPTGTMSF